MDDESQEAIEAQATEQGWRADYEGPNKTDAKTFVEKGDKIAGLLKNRVDRLIESDEKKDRQIEQLQQNNRDFAEYTKGQQDKLRAENEGLLSQLEEKRSAAIDDGNGAEFTRLDREIDLVREDLQPVTNGESQARSPEASAWVASGNEWYDTDPDLRAYADGVCFTIEQEGYRGPAYWQELTLRTKNAFPQKFENPNRDRSPAVESGGSTKVENSKEHKYENLPADAKVACDRYEKDGLITKEDYVKNYEW